MKILAINQIRYNNPQYNIKSTAQNTPQATQNGIYNPIYYRDYNIQLSFGKRSPEDFYSQPANQEFMPKCMKEYLYENYAERSKIAPVQIMQEAYDDLSVAQTVDDIKELFPVEREPKFALLRPAEYKPSKNGILGKIGAIKAMQENPEPLFKDGCDDLTTYLVKKIYLEGKTVKEIDKDFAKDINEIYELAARVPEETKKSLGKNESLYFSHSTTYGLGIRFPETRFWNSFIYTRDDYEHTARVKTKNGFVNAEDVNKAAKSASTTTSERPKAPQKPRKYNFKRDEVKNLTDIIINTNEGSQKALKEAKRRGHRNPEELTFLQKYWSEIMTLATEKVHLSEEMIDFNATRKNAPEKLDSAVLDNFINGGIITKRQKTPLKIFWDQRPDLKDYFSTSITDVIMQFTDAYGADGENDYFKALLEDAHNAKPNRELARAKHDLIQAEYDEMGRKLMEEEAKPKEAEKLVESVKTAVEEVQAPEPEFKYIIDGVDINASFDLKKRTYQLLENDFRLIPQKLKHTYFNIFENIIKDNPNRYYLSYTADETSVEEPVAKLLFSEDELLDVNKKIIKEMDENHNAEMESFRLAVIKFAQKHGLVSESEIMSFKNQDILNVRDFVEKRLPEGTKTEDVQREIQDIYNQISRPLSNKERIQIRTTLMRYIQDYKDVDTRGATNFMQPVTKQLGLCINLGDHYKNLIRKLFDTNALEEVQGPSMRYILESGGSEAAKEIIREHSVRSLFTRFPGECSFIMHVLPKELAENLQRFPQELEVIKMAAQQIMLRAK